MTLTESSPAATASASPPPNPTSTVGGEPAPIGVDPSFGEDNDSAFGDDYIDSTASIGSSILRYRKLHGRTFQNFEGVEYWGPNDETQNEGLDIFHHMMFLAHDNKLFLAPIKNPQKVLDVGTGTGIWAIDFADEFPSAEVIGTDISPIQPLWTPPNCKFELDDASLDWTFPDNTFDYIHMRWLVGTFKDWVKLYQECYRCLKPGGWLEHSDFSGLIQSDDGSLPEDNVWSLWYEVLVEAGEKMGRTYKIIEDDRNAGWMKEAGFPGPVYTHRIKLPIGSWPAERKWKDVGIYNKLANETSLEGYILYICTNVLGWEYEEVQVMLAKGRAALKNRAYHSYYAGSTVWAQKPIN